MRNQKQNARLQQARGQLFICGMFGNCASSVLSPRTPPDMADFGQKAAFVWAANDCALQQQIINPVDANGVTLHCEIDMSAGSPSSSDGARSSIASEVSSTSPADLEELLAEINAGNVTKMTISSLNRRLAKDCRSSREMIRSSGVASSLLSLLLSSNLAVTDGTGARDSVDERHVPHVLEESLAALVVLAEEDVATTNLMATPEFLTVATWYVSKGRKDARESACLLLEKLSLEESFKGTMGSSSGVMEALNDLLRDEKHLKLVKVATRTLLALCLLRENRRRAVEVGAVASLLEMLPRARSATAEKALATLELLGTIDEGKAAIIDHALAVPVLVELILRVSDRGTEYAAGTLSSMCSDSIAMREAAVAFGAPTKLLLLIQSDCTARAKRKASQLLKVLHKIWVQDPCNPDSEGTKAIHY